MNILSNIIENVTTNFEESIKKYKLKDFITNNSINDFNNYINMIKCIDDITYSFSTDLYSSFLTNIDNAFFNSKYRRNHCTCVGFYERTILTLFGYVTYKRRRYKDDFKNKDYFFVDEALLLNKNKNYDPFVCAKICEIASIDSYAKAGRTVSELIGKRLKFKDDPYRNIISRVSARNVVLNFNIPDLPYKQRKDVNTLYIMLDEKWVHSQFNNGKDHMIKAAVVFEDIEEVYSYQKKEDSKKRYKLLGKKVYASIDNDLKGQVLDYIYYTYNTDNIDAIVFMGDCATWIKAFPKDFKFHKNMKIIFSIDGYHYAQALQHICTEKYKDYINSFKDVIKSNNKQAFINLCEALIELEPNRKDTITDKQNYILNNWEYIQNYYYNVSMKCSMESHISHCFADIFSSRPRAYSKNGLRQLLKLRLLRVNGEDIQQIYFNVILNKYDNLSIDSSIFHPGDVSNYYYNNEWIAKYFSFG